MISQYLQQSIRNIQAEKENAVKAAIAKVTAEEIAPFNAQIDKMRDNALQEKANEHNKAVAALSQQLARERQEILAAAEKKKKENAELVIARETAAITIAYDKAVTKLTDLASEMDKEQN